MRKKVIIAVIAVGIIGLGAYFIPKQFNQKPILVREVTPESIKVSRTVSSSGKVTSQETADLALSGTGKIQNLSVSKGELVAQGQTLASISNFDSYQSSVAAREAIEVAEKDLDIYIENYETNPDAVGGKDEYNLNVQRLQNLVERARASYQASLGYINNTILTAPFSGTVIDVFKEEGEVIIAGTPVIKLADLENLVFEVSLDQEDFGLVEVGQKVIVTLDPYEDKEFEGVVTELPFYADENTEEFTVKIAISNGNAETPVLLGMNGDVEIVIEESTNEVQALSFDAIFEDDGGSYIWIDSKGQLSKVKVETGLVGDIYTQVKTELRDYVIVVPEDEIEPEEGLKVRYDGQ